MDTDTRVQTDVMNELKWEPSIDAADIGVSASNGAVTLTGHVPSYFAKTRAVHSAERVYAVRTVADELEVHLPTSGGADDTEIAETIALSLTWNVAVPAEVKAEVANGFVTLTGSVDSHFQRRAAERAVTWHAGVRGVTNLIEVREAVNSGDVEKLIRSAFHRNASLDARRVRVTAKGGTVSLHGNVHSADELRTARYAAYAAPGVTAVDNHLVVSP